MIQLTTRYRLRKGLMAMGTLLQYDFNPASLAAAEKIQAYLKSIDYISPHKEKSGREEVSRNVAAMWAVEQFSKAMGESGIKEIIGKLYRQHDDSDRDGGKHRGSMAIAEETVEQIRGIGEVIEKAKLFEFPPRARFKSKDGYNQKLIIGIALLYAADNLPK